MAEAAGRVALRGRVSGRVQGVAFRASMALQAGRLGVSGWVRNTAAGEVEFHAEGLAAAVDALVAWAGQGPAAAEVTGVVTEPTAAAGTRGFRVQR